MQLNVTEELVQICKEIVAESKTEELWAEIESDDMFQSNNYAGGFDADEMEFCFSSYQGNSEYWFQFSLAQAFQIASGIITHLDARLAE